MYGTKAGNLDFVNGVDSFVQTAKAHKNLQDDGYVYCPCIDCKNQKQFGNVEQIRFHLLFRGFMPNYQVWNKHGEVGETMHSVHEDRHETVEETTNPEIVEETGHESVNETMQETLVADDVVDALDQMIRDAEPDFLDKKNLKKLEQMRIDARTPLYPSCSVSKLEANLMLLEMKSSNGLSDKGFDDLLSLLQKLLPSPNGLPENTYQAKQMICPMGLEVQKIHACPKDCILYHGKYEDLDACPVCSASRYKCPESALSMKGDRNKRPPAKVVWYFPIIPRLKRLFANAKTAKLMRWHAEDRLVDGNLRHPADGSQWRAINYKYKNRFAKEIRNIRFGLSTDGMCPFNMVSSKHSTWPVTLCIYNLPPWLCMKRTYIMMPLLIQGPKQPGNDIDVYLEPLVDDLMKLWNDGVKVWDEYKREHFTLKAILFVTITDLPGLGSLAGQVTKGYKGCVVCLDDTDARWLKNSNKMVYMGHRRFLPKAHPYRRNKKSFDGTRDERLPPKFLDGKEIYKKVSKLRVVLGKGKGSVPAPADSLWKKNSLFWRLPYWQDLIVRHALDGMHLTKNVTESTLGTLMAMKGKGKDSLETRQDLQDMNVRSELHPITQHDGKTKLPVASWTLDKIEKRKICSFFHELKVPTGYSSNIRRLANMKELKFNMSCMKAHDCHVIMTQLLPVALRGVLPVKVRDPIIKLCSFFNAISHKVIDPNTLDKLQADLIHTINRLEMHFPPTFFDISVHLITHLVAQIKALGPIFLHQMFPFERLMSVLRKYVRNRYRPEGCMVNGWSTEEAVEFCTYYLDLNRMGVPVSRHEGRLGGRGMIGEQSVRIDDLASFNQAHFTVLQQASVVSPYIEMHKRELQGKYRGRSEAWLTKQHKEEFGSWLRLKLAGVDTGNAQLDLLAIGPSSTVLKFQGYEINAYTFYTRKQDEKSTNQNSGVRIDAYNDNRQLETYYGFIEEIWELEYGPLKIPLFRCQWIKLPKGVFTDKYGMTVVDLTNIGYRDEPFIWAKDVVQVFYAKDLANEGKHVVLQGKRKIVGVENMTEDEEKGFQDMPPLGPDIDLPVFEEGEEPAYVRLDHNEALIVN